MKKVIITGPTGAVGISLIHELIENNIFVTAVCRKNSSRIANIPKNALVQIVECDLNELSGLSDILSADFDVFYHFAWDGTYGDSRQDLSLQSGNIGYTLDAVNLAHSLGCKIFIGAGSQGEFGHVEGVLHPDTPCNPVTGYGVAKLAACQMSRLRCGQLGMKHIWCRILSMYGPYDGMHTMIMSNIYKMLTGEYAKFTPGEQVWDYIYNKDAARAFRLVAEKGRDKAIYCIGSGETRRLRDYIITMRDIINPNIKVGIGEVDYYPNQVMHLEADITSLTNDTGFLPKYSFEEGIRETIKWIKEQI